MGDLLPDLVSGLEDASGVEDVSGVEGADVPADIVAASIAPSAKTCRSEVKLVDGRMEFPFID